MDQKRYEEIIERLFLTTPLIRKKVVNQNINKRFDLTSQHTHILLNLKEKGPLVVSELANLLDICKSNITPLIQKLIDKGYIRRNTDDNDRRYIYITLTDTGREFLEIQKQAILEDLQIKLADINEEDLEKLEHSLIDLNDVLTKMK